MNATPVLAMFLVVLAMTCYMVNTGEATVTCGDVTTSLASCMTYLENGGDPSTACCQGVQKLKTLTPTTADRRAACDCVKAAAAHFPNIKEDAASSLPTKCNVPIGIPISKTTNCATID